MRFAPFAWLVGVILTGTLVVGCAEPESAEQDAIAMSGPVNRPGSASEVWEVRNAWSDTDTEAAKEAGIAWDADSGLSWEEKYEQWVESLEIVERESHGKTFAMRTPYGNKSLAAPNLDCGEVAYTMRLAFASWYHLPFYVKGWYEGKALFGGHFGFVGSDGVGHGSFPSFKNRYSDHEGSWEPGMEWPEDKSLRKKRLGDDDRNEWLEGEGGEIAGVGVYFDEIFLNKRAGHFARLLLLFYGSVNLASSANLYHVDAAAIRAGDVLLKRSHRV